MNSLDYLENMMVGPIVQCMLGYPLSIDVDSKSLIEKSCNRDLSYKNYRGKFLVSKKLAVRKT